MIEIDMLYKDPISYIVPAFNCADTLQETVASIFNGNFEQGDEIIVINDGSTDDTQSVIDELCAKHDAIVALQHPINKGSAAASRNTGIARARNELIFCLDADNILAPNSVLELKQHLLQTNADAAAFGALYYFKDIPQHVTHKDIYKGGIITLSDALSGGFWPGPSGNYLYTKESWWRAGRYHEFVGGAYDSWAFGIRQLAVGIKMVTLENTFYYHRYGHESAFVRHTKGVHNSLVALQVVLPFLDLIEEEDIDYIMSRDARYTWFENLRSRPLRVKGQGVGISGHREISQELSLFQKIKSRLVKLITCLRTI